MSSIQPKIKQRSDQRFIFTSAPNDDTLITALTVIGDTITVHVADDIEIFKASCSRVDPLFDQLSIDSVLQTGLINLYCKTSATPISNQSPAHRVRAPWLHPNGPDQPLHKHFIIDSGVVTPEIFSCFITIMATFQDDIKTRRDVILENAPKRDGSIHTHKDAMKSLREDCSNYRHLEKRIFRRLLTQKAIIEVQKNYADYYYRTGKAVYPKFRAAIQEGQKLELPKVAAPKTAEKLVVAPETAPKLATPEVVETKAAPMEVSGAANATNTTTVLAENTKQEAIQIDFFSALLSNMGSCFLNSAGFGFLEGILEHFIRLERSQIMRIQQDLQVALLSDNPHYIVVYLACSLCARTDNLISFLPLLSSVTMRTLATLAEESRYEPTVMEAIGGSLLISATASLGYISGNKVAQGTTSLLRTGYSYLFGGPKTSHHSQASGATSQQPNTRAVGYK